MTDGMFESLGQSCALTRFFERDILREVCEVSKTRPGYEANHQVRTNTIRYVRTQSLV